MTTNKTPQDDVSKDNKTPRPILTGTKDASKKPRRRHGKG